MGGIDLELLNLLGAAPVRTPADFEAILARLRGFPDEVEQTLDSLRKGLAKGITPPRVTLREVPARVASLLADDPWKSAVLDPFRTLPATIAATGFKGTFAELSQFLRTDPRFFYDRPEDLVAGFRDITKRIDPGLIKLFGRLPRLPYGVKAMEGEGAKTAPAAYYNNGSLAGGNPGWFLINTYDLKSRPKWAMEALALHETVPGHHLQYSLAEEIEDIPDWRKWDVYPVFGEGWGLYAESLGSELGLYRDPYSKIGQLTNEIWRAIRLVVDPALHVKGWSRQEALDYYRANCAKSDHEIEAEVDRIIVHPGSVPVYKIGELKIRELRAYAERELGPDFDIRAFHDRLLGRGQLPLDLLEASMKAWVAEVKAGLGRKGAP